jgi:hypothetical protein
MVVIMAPVPSGALTNPDGPARTMCDPRECQGTAARSGQRGIAGTVTSTRHVPSLSGARKLAVILTLVASISALFGLVGPGSAVAATAGSVSSLSDPAIPVYSFGPSAHGSIYITIDDGWFPRASSP